MSFTLQDFVERAKEHGFSNEEVEGHAGSEIDGLMWDFFQIVNFNNKSYTFDEEYVMDLLISNKDEMTMKEKEVWLSFLPKISERQQDVINFFNSDAIDNLVDVEGIVNGTITYYEFDNTKYIRYFADGNGEAMAYIYGAFNVYGEFNNAICFLQIQNFETNIFLIFNSEKEMKFFLTYHCKINIWED